MIAARNLQSGTSVDVVRVALFAVKVTRPLVASGCEYFGDEDSALRFAADTRRHDPMAVVSMRSLS